ncbi:MAG: hypothetical protein Q4Q07_09170 [Tissierellia bacterium]|nr:hypothetical protein [Tissierellia bacterium]
MEKLKKQIPLIMSLIYGYYVYMFIVRKDKTISNINHWQGKLLILYTILFIIFYLFEIKKNKGKKSEFYGSIIGLITGGLGLLILWSV